MLHRATAQSYQAMACHVRDEVSSVREIGQTSDSLGAGASKAFQPWLEGFGIPGWRVDQLEQ